MTALLEEYRAKQVWLCAFFVGLLAHMYALTNKLLISDEVVCLFGGGGNVTFGRWLYFVILYLVDKIFGNYSMPWLYGVTSMMLLAIVCVVVCVIFEIKSRIGQFFVVNFIMCTPVIVETLAFMFLSPFYSISILLGTCAVWVANKTEDISKKTFLRMGISIGLIAASMGIYQAYIGFIVGLMILRLMYECTLPTYNHKDIFYHGLADIIDILGGGIVYLVCGKIMLWLTRTDMADYKGIAEVGKRGIDFYLTNIVSAYKLFFSMFVEDFYGLTPSIWFRISLGIGCVVAVVFTIWSIRDVRKKILYIMCVCMLPLVINIMFVICDKEYIYTLMLLSHVVVLLVPCIFIVSRNDICRWGIIKNILIVCMLIQVANYVVVDNECYLALQLNYNQGYAYCNTLISRIQSTPGYRDDMSVVIVGSMPENKTIPHMEEFDNISNLEWIGKHTGWYMQPQFMKYYLGFAPNWIEDPAPFEAQNVVNQMNVYPDDGSIAIVDDTVVVKMGRY